MALEAAGLALGAAGLAGLFSSRVHCLELVDLGRAQKRDLALLHAKLENQKAIFVAWGQSIGLESSDDVKIALQKIQPLYHDRIVATMQQVGLLFWESPTLKRRYGLEEGSADYDAQAYPLEPSAFRALFHRL